MKKYLEFLRKFFGSTLICLVALSTQIPGVYAISSQQKALFDEGINYFNYDGSGPSAAGGNSCMQVGLPTINDAGGVAKAIDDYIKQNGAGSPFDGLGNDIVAGASAAGVNPFLVVAIAQHESGFGQPNAIPSADSHNAFGRTAAPGQPFVMARSSAGDIRAWYKWDSWKDSVNWTGADPLGGGGRDEPSFIKVEYLDSGQTTITAFAYKYAPPTDHNNTTGYIDYLNNVLSKLVDASGSALSCSLSGPAGDQIVAVAQQELGLWSSGQLKPGSDFKKYTQGRAEDWCADFVSWVYDQAGVPLGPAGSYHNDWDVPLTDNLRVPPQDSTKFVMHAAAGYTPQPGDIALHSSPGNPWSHANIVVAVSGSTITLVGGNQAGTPFTASKVTSYPQTISTPNDIVDYVSPVGGQ